MQQAGGFSEPPIIIRMWCTRYKIIASERLVLWMNLILDAHCVRIDSLLPRHALKTRKDAAIVVLVGVKGEPALLTAIVPSETDKVLLRFRQRHQCAET